MKLAQPDSHHKESAKALSSGSAAPTPSDPIANSQSPASLLWGLAPEPPTDSESPTHHRHAIGSCSMYCVIKSR